MLYILWLKKDKEVKVISNFNKKILILTVYAHHKCKPMMTKIYIYLIVFNFFLLLRQLLIHEK